MRSSHVLRNERGSILATVLVIFSSITTVGLFLNYQALEKKRAIIGTFQKANSTIETDNYVKVSSALAQSKLQSDPTISSADLQTYLQQQLQLSIKPPFEIKAFSASLDGTSFYQLIPNGPFKGIESENQRLVLSLTIGAIGSSFYNSTLSVKSTISGIPITQFTVFAQEDLYQAIGYQNVEYSGRIHANGDLAIAGTTIQTKIRGSITVAGHVLGPQTVYGAYFPWQTHIALAPTYLNATLTRLKETATSGCVACDGTASSWAAYAINRWQGQLQDSYHGVSKLTIKTLESPTGQAYASRFPIEPVRAAENLSRKEKFAYKADIRIINGVWYLKNPNNPDDWPGIAIWSDHPGNFNTWNDDQIEGSSRGVGQEDIRDWLNTSGPTANRWPANTTPVNFSFYPYDTANETLAPSSTGTVSYGNLYRDNAGGGTWSPGHYASATLCQAGETCTSGCSNTVISVNAQISCLDGTTGITTLRSDPRAYLLNGTRGGFRYGVIQEAAYGRDAKSKMWPMNFDLNAFQNSLNCTAGVSHPGELGCYFGTPSFMGRSFNGVVYVANTWNGQNRLTSLYPQRAPYLQTDTETVQVAFEGGGSTQFPGSTVDADQPAPHVATQGMLPMQLCSTSFAGRKFSSVLFKVPNCNSYRDHITFRARINSLRITNARTISSAQLPRGITIVTNLPLYSVGDVNSNSDVSSATSTPWLPVFIAGDYYVPLSNAWDDTNSRWDVRTNTSPLGTNRIASTTTVNAASSPQVFYYNENWSGRLLNKTGPHISFAPEPLTFFTNAATLNYGQATYYNPSTIFYKEDPHFRSIANQPPGMPFVSVFSVDSWVTSEAAKEANEITGP